MTHQEFLTLSVEDQLREERISIMIFDGGMTEEEAIAILDQKQGKLFEQNMAKNERKGT